MLNSLKLCLSVMLVPFLLALVCLLVLTGACTTLLLRWETRCCRVGRIHAPAKPRIRRPRKPAQRC